MRSHGVIRLEMNLQQPELKQLIVNYDDKLKIGQERTGAQSGGGGEREEQTKAQQQVNTTESSSAGLVVDTNINVIFDSEHNNNSNCVCNCDHGGQSDNSTTLKPNSTTGSGHDEQQQAKSAGGSKMSDFVNFDRVEAENGGYEKENYASCLVEKSPNDSEQINDQWGRLNFWQPINNRGVLHMVAHYTYKFAEQQQQQLRQVKQLRRRESFRAPIERLPTAADSSPTTSSLDQLIRSNHLNRDQIWLVNSCDPNDFTAAADDKTIDDSSGSQRLVAELTRQLVEPAMVEVDSELIVGQFNLTGLNEITNKHLLVVRRQDKGRAARIACCKVSQTDTMPASDLPERANKTTTVQLTQATRDSSSSSHHHHHHHQLTPTSTKLD